MTHATHRTCKDVLWQEIGPEVVVLDLPKGKYYALNRTAAHIWKLVLAEGTEASRAESYAKTFGQSLERAQADIEAAVRDFEGRGFLQRVEPA